MRGVFGALTIVAFCAACSAPAPQPAANTDAAAHEAHEAYVTAINSNNRDADGKWRVARDAWGPDHPAK